MQINDFLRLLSVIGMDRPVIDRTALKGYFDLELQYGYGPFGRFGTPQVGTNGISFFTALQEQAGLKLEPAREVVDVLVIDSAEQPTPN